MASIENHPFVLLIHEIKISPRPDPEARDPAQREWSSPPTYEPPTNLRTWTVIYNTLCDLWQKKNHSSQINMSFDLSFGFPLSSLVKGFESIDYRITSTQKSCENS